MKSQFKKILPLCMIVLGLCNMAHAQLYISNASFVTQKGALVYVDGDVTYTGKATQTVDHQGMMEVKGNWNNTAATDAKVFTDTSGGVVLMSGAQQAFNGKNTRFPNLTLAGTGLKRQFTTIEVMDILDLTDRELDVNGNVASVLSDNIDAIVYDMGGYVNTNTRNTGWLERNMNAANMYVFPLGNNSGGSYKFRPLVLKSQQGGNTYAQFQNYDPAKDGYSTMAKEDNIDAVNNNWYHAVMTGNTSDSISMVLPYSSVADGNNFTSIVKWAASVHKWQLQPSDGPRLSTTYNTNDSYFQTVAAILLSANAPVPVHLGMINKKGPFIPNVITPNGDGKNDTWEISGFDPAATMDVVIFNRWGNQVYQSSHYDNKWGGKGLNEGTYFYVLKIKQPTGKEDAYKGFIMLMR